MEEYKYLLTIKCNEEPTEEQLFDISSYVLDRVDFCKEAEIYPVEEQ